MILVARNRQPATVLALAILLPGFAAGSISSSAIAQQPDPLGELKAMSDYMAGQSHLSARVEVDLEVITPEIEKLQFSSSGSFALMRPDRLRFERTGGYSHVELLFDGETLTIVDLDGKVFARQGVPGTVDDLVDHLRGDLGVEAPGADLLLSNLHEVLNEGVIEAKHIGIGVIDGVECNHLAFRNADTDWQIWIEDDDTPLPRKYVITSKTVAAAPQYTIRIHDWSLDATSDPGAFQLVDDAGMREVLLHELGELDELPSAATH